MLKSASHPAVGLTLFLASLLGATASAQHATLTLQVSVESSKPQHRKDPQHAKGAMAMPIESSNAVVAWLTPLAPGPANTPRPPLPSQPYILTQKDKQFHPHLLVVPTGSSVVFPNLDPFFHNVFSLFNGRRFDLGLYEAGSRRSVRFDHPGVSYIFCNIHPEMGAVVVSLDTPFYAVSNGPGVIQIQNLPSGDYDLNLWSENVPAESLAAAHRRIHIATENLALPPIVLGAVPSQNRHLNKFGEEYPKPLNPY